MYTLTFWSWGFCEIILHFWHILHSKVGACHFYRQGTSQQPHYLHMIQVMGGQKGEKLRELRQSSALLSVLTLFSDEMLLSRVCHVIKVFQQ